MNKIQEQQLRRVRDEGTCDGRSARAFFRLGYIEPAARTDYKLTPAGRRALKELGD